jgi:hypothetical protein
VAMAELAFQSILVTVSAPGAKSHSANWQTPVLPPRKSIAHTQIKGDGRASASQGDSDVDTPPRTDFVQLQLNGSIMRESRVGLRCRQPSDLRFSCSVKPRYVENTLITRKNIFSQKPGRAMSIGKGVHHEGNSITEPPIEKTDALLPVYCLELSLSPFRNRTSGQFLFRDRPETTADAESYTPRRF